MYRLTAALILLCAPVLAQDIDCSQAMAQLELNFCAELDWQAADADLNVAYQQVVAEMQEIDANLPEDLQGAEEALRAAQRAWVTYRDANCAAAGYPMRGGSAEPLLIYGCPRQMTVDRTQELLQLNAF